MGLRDRYASNFYIPLFAGIESARRGGLLAPPDIYAPGIIDGGSGSPGGIGQGDGGNSTPCDPDIQTPTILFPNADDQTRILVTETALSDEFVSVTPGEAHVKSRWVIELRPFPANGSGGSVNNFFDVTDVTEDTWAGYDNFEEWYEATQEPQAQCETKFPGSTYYRTFGPTAGTAQVQCVSPGPPAEFPAETGTPKGAVLYDSGPTAVDLTDLPFTKANLGKQEAFAIKVRYKGTGGGWSCWSPYQPFTTQHCATGSDIGGGEVEVQLIEWHFGNSGATENEEVVDLRFKPEEGNQGTGNTDAFPATVYLWKRLVTRQGMEDPDTGVITIDLADPPVSDVMHPDNSEGPELTNQSGGSTPYTAELDDNVANVWAIVIAEPPEPEDFFEVWANHSTSVASTASRLRVRQPNNPESPTSFDWYYIWNEFPEE